MGGSIHDKDISRIFDPKCQELSEALKKLFTQDQRKKTEGNSWR